MSFPYDVYREFKTYLPGRNRHVTLSTVIFSAIRPFDPQKSVLVQCPIIRPYVYDRLVIRYRRVVVEKKLIFKCPNNLLLIIWFRVFVVGRLVEVTSTPIHCFSIEMGSSTKANLSGRSITC